MINLKLITMLGFASSLLMACATSTQQGDMEDEEKKNKGTLMLFSVKEPGTEVYRSEIFVNKSVMVMQDSRAGKDFLLFDRKTQTIYSTNSADQTIFVIKPKPLTAKSPIALEVVETSQPSGAIPKVESMRATHYRYEVNGEHCYDAVAMPAEFMPEVAAAMKEFRTVLAAEHATTLDSMPEDTLDPCDLAQNIFYATKHYEHGLPIREWDRKGNQRFLLDYKKDVNLDPKGYELPKEYRQYSISDM